MPIFISIFEDPKPVRASRIIAISGPRLVEIIGEEISKRMGKRNNKTKEEPKEDKFNERL